MKKVAIIIDDWKLEIFQKVLDRGGFKYEQFAGVAPYTITFKVETETVEKLKPFVIEANSKAAYYKAKKLH